MARLHFTPNLVRHLGVAALDAPGSTLREVLDSAFSQLPGARSYVLDDQGHVRHHVALFLNGTLVHDRNELALAVAADAELWVMQALSGG